MGKTTLPKTIMGTSTPTRERIDLGVFEGSAGELRDGPVTREKLGV